MKKIFKWPGGKSRELKIIRALVPENIEKIIEPFSGSAAVAFDFEIPAVLNDLDRNIINFYKVMQNKEGFDYLKEKILYAKSLPYVLKGTPEYGVIHSLGDEYYLQRTVLNEGNFDDPFAMAYAFFITRQLSFSGMLRYNANTGNYNVPYGWYKSFSNNVTEKHFNYLRKCTITSNDYKISIINNDKENNWLFIDPPYRKRVGYPSEEWSDKQHIELAESLKGIKNAKWLLVHCDDELYRELYKNYNIIDKNCNYGIAFKDRNVNDRKVKHMYIKNY